MSDKFATTEVPLDDGKTLPVAQLPLEIREAIEFFDKLRADLAEATRQQNILMIATQAWNTKIATDIGSFLNPEEPMEETTEVAESTDEVKKVAEHDE